MAKMAKISWMGSDITSDLETATLMRKFIRMTKPLYPRQPRETIHGQGQIPGQHQGLHIDGTKKLNNIIL